MITQEKPELTPADREYIINVLDQAYQMAEPLAKHMAIFDNYKISRPERNAIILETDYALDEELVAALLLFG